jgi:hypothetical protein
MSWSERGLEWSLILGCVLALQAALLALINLRRYRRARPLAVETPLPSISVCVPARNEETNIEACVRSVLSNATTQLSVEVLCYDDQSNDRTPDILASLAAEDGRVRLVRTCPLPAGWNGKQHACWRMAHEAKGRWFLFTDADVRFAPDALGRSIATAEAAGVALLSTVPFQRLGTVGEALIIPLIHVLLLSYLPFGRMRSTLEPSASAGCGQFLLVRADAYRATGGHAQFPDSMHDGIRMPRLLRQHGFRTDLFDGTDLVECRMYRGLAQTWRGFVKNAYEGLGSPALLVALTIMHLLGHVWPWVILALAGLGLVSLSALGAAAAGAAIVFSLVARAALASRFGQPRWIAFAHPISIVLMTLIQWHSFAAMFAGRREWKGRKAGATTAATATT